MYRSSFAAALPQSTFFKRHGIGAVFFAAFAWFGGLACLRPLALPDEGRYVGIAWEMLSSGNWITPTLDGLPFFHKPPLFYWITAAAMHVFGAHEWVARAAPVLAGATTLTVVFAACREWLGESTARMATLALATLPLFCGGAQYANMDSLVAACISATVLFGALAALRYESGVDSMRHLTSAYVAAALGVLAKGLIGLVLPGLVLLIWLGVVRRWRALRWLLWWPGVLFFLVIVSPWFITVEWTHPGFLHYFFVVQQFQRFTGSGFNNVEPLWFYVPIVAGCALPWPAWLLNLRRSNTVHSSRSAVLSLMFVWLGVVLIFFSIPQSKPIGYVLPALPPLAILIALTAAPLVQRSRSMHKAWLLCVATGAFVCVSVTIGFAVVKPKSSRALTAVLAANRGAQEGLAFIDEYRYDVSFYLRDASPAYVVSDWDPLEVQQHDNWRKELFDAEGFAPRGNSKWLLNGSDFTSGLCSGRIKWVMAALDSAIKYPMLNTGRIVAVDRRSALWKIDAANAAFAAAAGCINAVPR